MLRKFRIAWEQLGLDGSDLTTEYHWHPIRKWRFDVAFPSRKVAVEFVGMGFGHQRIGALANEHERENAAVELGWRILQIDNARMSMTRLPAFIEQVCRVLANEQDPEKHRKWRD